MCIVCNTSCLKRNIKRWKITTHVINCKESSSNCDEHNARLCMEIILQQKLWRYLFNRSQMWCICDGLLLGLLLRLICWGAMRFATYSLLIMVTCFFSCTLSWHYTITLAKLLGTHHLHLALIAKLLHWLCLIFFFILLFFLYFGSKLKFSCFFCP